MISLLARFLLDPFNLLWIWAILMVIIWYSGKGKHLKWLVITWISFFLIVSTPLVPVLMVNSLEDRYLPLDTELFQPVEGRNIHVLVLGGGHGYDDRLPANALLSSNARGRLMEGIRLHRQIPDSKLVLSGSTSTPGRLTQAEMLKETALLMGGMRKIYCFRKSRGIRARRHNFIAILTGQITTM